MNDLAPGLGGGKAILRPGRMVLEETGDYFMTKPHIRKQNGFWWCDRESDDPFMMGVGDSPDGAYRHMIARNHNGWQKWFRDFLQSFYKQDGRWIS